MRDSYEVIVVGGGTAGMVAAIQAGRAGARTLLIEKQGILGGTMVVGGVAYPASFHAYGRQVIAGIGWDLCCQARREAGQSTPDPATGPPQDAGRYHFRVDAPLLAALADGMVRESGAEILFHAMPAAARPEDGGWVLTVCTKTGLSDVRGRFLVDCTGDANLVELAGLAVDRPSVPQAATLVVRASGYDAGALDHGAIQAAFEREVAAGRMRRSDPGWGHGRFDFFLKAYGGNRIHVPGLDARTSEGKTVAEIEGRQAMLRIQRFCRRQPGLADFRIDSCATECGIREGARIRGRETVTIRDYESGRLWTDAVCYSFYPVDIHRDDHLVFRELKPGVYPTIPLGAMVPAGARGIIAAGRCISGDSEAHSAYRVQASCMAMGQAAGAAAALAAKTGVDVADVSLDDLRALLRRHGAIVPDDVTRNAEAPGGIRGDPAGGR